MANDQAKVGAGTFIVLPAFLAWAFVAVGIVARQPALDTARPEAGAFSERAVVGDETLPARLWQDPLQTAYQAYQEYLDTKKTVRPVSITDAVRDTVLRWLGCSTPPDSPTPGKPLNAEQLAESISKHAPDNQQVLVLPVFLAGRAYSEDAENRLRTRYAVLSALSVAGYVPEERNHIGYFTMPYQPKGDSAKTAQRTLVIPFEWYQPNPLYRTPREDAYRGAGREPAVSPRWQRVLVLWIDQHQVETGQLAVLDQIIRGLEPADAGPWPTASRAAASASSPKKVVRVLGPTSSNALLDMLREVRKWLPEELSGVEFYSPWATISGKLLEKELEAPGRQESAANLMKKLNLVRTIAGDRATCQLLVDELKLRRQPNVRREQMHVALIAEWDTAYARALPKTFEDIYLDRKVGILSEGPPDANMPDVRFYSYLQGLDGRLPGKQLAQRADTPEQVAAMERPEGKAQLDYVRRLGTQLKRFDQRLRRDGRGQVRAVGILGSDVYDKLLILRALKPDFPGVIFFTTDLDACLLHPDEQKWTRNLVVASPFGLRLRDELQAAIPPFRDSYQTSVFFATRCVLGDDERLLKRREPLPRIFEIGRTTAHDLSLEADFFPHPVHPRGQFKSVLGRYWKLWIALFCGSVLLFLVTRWLHGSVKERSLHAARFWIAMFLALLVTAALCRAIWTDHRLGGEPFAAFDGVSIWPTELLRLVVFLLSCYYLINAWRELEQNNQDIGKELCLPSTVHRTTTGQAQASGGSRWLKKLLGLLRIQLGVFCYILRPGRLPKGDVAELWRAYLRRRRVLIRVPRVAVYLGLHVATFVLLFRQFGFPTIPGRGEFSFDVDFWLLIFSLGSLLALVYLVLDLTRLCDWFVRQLVEPKTRVWPDRIRGKWASEPSLPGVLPSADRDEWLSIRLIAVHTTAVGKLIYYPFIVLFIMFLSRHQIFDAWDWPIPLIVVISFVFVVAICAAVILRWSAKRARGEVLARLRKRLIAVRESRQLRRAKMIEQFVAEIEAERRGAFCPLGENPVLHALLIPSGGLGMLAVLDRLLGGL